MGSTSVFLMDNYGVDKVPIWLAMRIAEKGRCRRDMFEQAVRFPMPFYTVIGMDIT